MRQGCHVLATRLALAQVAIRKIQLGVDLLHCRLEPPPPKLRGADSVGSVEKQREATVADEDRVRDGDLRREMHMIAMRIEELRGRVRRGAVESHYDLRADMIAECFNARP